MGLKLVAHYYEPVEALIARSVIEAAGMLVIMQNHQWLSVMPYHVGALGGYRLVVSELDLDDAAAVLCEAKANPLTDGEVYESRANFSDHVFSFVLGFLAGGIADANVWWPLDRDG